MCIEHRELVHLTDTVIPQARCAAHWRYFHLSRRNILASSPSLIIKRDKVCTAYTVLRKYLAFTIYQKCNSNLLILTQNILLTAYKHIHLAKFNVSSIVYNSIKGIH